MFAAPVKFSIILLVLLQSSLAHGYDRYQYEYKRRDENRRQQQYQQRHENRQRRRRQHQQREEDAAKKAICSIDNTDHQYEWEGTNFYDLLALPFNDTETTSVAQVKKAYRRQAQEWHPDKKKASDELSEDEINARFRRISLAHEVLSDPAKKQEYDEWMMYCSADDEPIASHTDYEELVHVELLDRQTFIDPSSGLLIVRIIQREEYETHYRVVAQDYSPGPNGYTPLFDEPMIVEEGSFTNDERSGVQSSSTEAPEIMWSTQLLLDSSTRSSQQHRQGGDDTILTHLQSSNGRYEAGIVNCQLIVIDKFDKETEEDEYDYMRHDNSNHNDPKIIWKSNNRSPPWARDCILKLHGPHLVLQHDDSHVLWYSESDEQYMDDFIVNNNQKNNSYFARLDNDGTLTVYHRGNDDDDDEDDEVDRHFSNIYENQKRHRQKFGAAFDHKFQSLFHDEEEEPRAKKPPFISKWLDSSDKCVFSTSPSGCHRLKRKIRHVMKDVKHIFKIVEEKWTKTDTYHTNFDDDHDHGHPNNNNNNGGRHPYDDYEEDDEYIDLVEEVAQFVSRAGYHVSRVGRKLLLQSAQTLRSKFGKDAT